MSKGGWLLKSAWGGQGSFRAQMLCRSSETLRMGKSLLGRQTDWGGMGQFKYREESE